MSKWPANDKPFNIEKLTDPLIKAMRFAYKMQRQNADKDIPWRGPDIGDRERANCPSPKTQLKAENLQYSDEEQGRDALEEIMGLAIRLGIEQGRRITMTGPEIETLRLKLVLAELMATKTATE
jgi:hypothetical protein